MKIFVKNFIRNLINHNFIKILSTKQLIPLFFVFSLFLLVGCEQPSTNNSSTYYKSEGPFSIEMESYENKKYGYSLELPKSWGAIQPYGSSFTDNLYDEMETIGPLLGNSSDPNEQYIDIEVFSDENARRETNQAWIDFYKKFRLEGVKYEATPIENTYSRTEFVLSDDAGQYKRTCWLMENNNTLYTFCFHRDNNIHWDIIHSIKLK